ncbi:MAG: (Fe-S)-binding protein [Chloroflexota bacterium]
MSVSSTSESGVIYLPEASREQCGEPTCYLFALKLAVSQKKLADCPPLAELQYVENLSALEKIVIEAPAI